MDVTDNPVYSSPAVKMRILADIDAGNNQVVRDRIALSGKQQESRMNLNIESLTRQLDTAPGFTGDKRIVLIIGTPGPMKARVQCY